MHYLRIFNNLSVFNIQPNQIENEYIKIFVDLLLTKDFSHFVQIENEYTDLKRRVELETNEIRDKQQV